MFLLNLGYRWHLASDIDDLGGVVFLPTGSHRERLRRSPLPESRRRLFDPQLYLAELSAEDCKMTCGRLVTYPWFGATDLPAFDSGELTAKKWEEAVRSVVADHWRGTVPTGADIPGACQSAIDFQLSIGCSHVILPSPLIGERENEAETQVQWLEAGIEAARNLEVGQPVLGTVAISEAVLNESTFEGAGFIDTVVDQLSSRDGLHGVYIVVVQTHGGHPFTTARLVHRAYLTLATRFTQTGYDTVITNFADLFGLVAMTGGATAFAGGESQKLRRISLDCFLDQGGGKALPHLYSHPMAGEFLSETDINKIVDAKLGRRLRDVTEYSEQLFYALDRGRTAAEVPQWAESQSNITAAQKHFIRRLALEGVAISHVAQEERPDTIRDWLDDAAANHLLVADRLGKSGMPGAFAPTAGWLELIDEGS